MNNTSLSQPDTAFYQSRLQARIYHIIEKVAVPQDYDRAHQWIADPSTLPDPDTVETFVKQFGIGRGTALIFRAILLRLYAIT